MSKSFKSAYADYKDLREQEEHNDCVYDELKSKFIREASIAITTRDRLQHRLSCLICRKTTFINNYENNTVETSFILNCGHNIKIENSELIVEGKN